MSRAVHITRQIVVRALLPYFAYCLVVIPFMIYLSVQQVAGGQRLFSTKQLGIELVQLANQDLEVEQAELVYQISGKTEAIEASRAARASFNEHLAALLRRVGANLEQRHSLQGLEQLERMRQPEDTDLRLRHNELRQHIARLQAAVEDAARQHARENEQAKSRLVILNLIMVAAAVGMMVTLMFRIIRDFNKNIGAIVQHMQSSAAELKSAATQQQRGAKGQASTATEVATTMHQLVASSRQIADSAQCVNVVAKDASSAAHTGDSTVLGAQSAVTQVKQLVDRIVSHMVDLGKRTQEIGSILDIINELAEQTNILAINATIEAAGAGDTGRRFALVAQEVRKLADRVGRSTKEIRAHIEQVRGAASMTVVVTEDGSKAVERSTRQFDEVATSFRKIVELIGTTAGAVHEIELSTKQQTTAVGQVSTAINDVAETAREAEHGSSQTLRTADELFALSQQLLQLVRPA